jgi:phosphopantetheinyl transferase
VRIAVPGAGTPILELLHEPDAEQLRFSARAWGNRLGTGRVSRSYAPPYALVAWHSHPVGVDIERVAPCDEHFARSICTPEEAARAPWTQDREIIGLWSGKEALAKALGDALRYDPRRLDSPAAWADGRSGPWRARALEVPDGYCAWACWRDPRLEG